MSRPCVHADSIKPVPPHGSGCETCLGIGDSWLHLRQCLTCGRTLCCDGSPNRHASRHAREAGHPIMRSAEPDEDWVFCFGDDAPIQETPGGWKAFDPFVMEGTMLAGEHLAAGGSLDADPGLVVASEFPLGDWVGRVRSLKAAGELDADDAAAIGALPGWTW
ncbi:MAG TPA: UBP-type zinc finger domain-containing protein [Kineosporiaceae bacterium]|nr:UBP-type zinc finger domain-containing protein [Kineosporiaceae bacterium]